MPATSLLLKYLSGDATPGEAAMIDTWIQSSEEHKAIFNRLWHLWQQTTVSTGYTAPDVQQEWNELLQKIQSPATPTPRKGFSWLRPLIVGTLILAVIIAIIILLVTGTGNKQPLYTIQQSNNAIARDTLFHTIIATLNTHSNIQYPAATGKENNVSIQQGGVFLQAAVNTGTVYSIQAGAISIQPGESSLYVQYDSATAVTTIQVAAGTVTVQAGRISTVLQQGEAISWNNNQQGFSKRYAADVNSYSYATRVFVFNDTPLKDAIRYLAKAYHLSIEINTPVISDCLITTRFDDKRIEYIMDIMSATLHFDYDYQRANNTIYLSGNGCE